MALLEGDEPVLPLGPRGVQVVELAEAVSTDQHGLRGGRAPGPTLLFGDLCLAPREVAVDRRQIGDEQRNDPEPEEGLHEREHNRRELVGPLETKGQERRPAELDGVPPRIDTERPEHRDEAEQDPYRPHARQQDQADRCKAGEDAVLVVERLDPRRTPLERPPHECEHRACDPHPLTPGDYHRPHR